MGELTGKITGGINDAVGKAKQATAGDANDPLRTPADSNREAEGTAQELKGKGQQEMNKSDLIQRYS